MIKRTALIAIKPEVKVKMLGVQARQDKVKKARVYQGKTSQEKAQVLQEEAQVETNAPQDRVQISGGNSVGGNECVAKKVKAPMKASGVGAMAKPGEEVQSQVEVKVQVKRKAKVEEPHYLGHRSRLRARFLSCNQASMYDYELLEMLLGIIQLRGDTKPAAKLLLRQFGSLAGVIGAEMGQLQSVKGIGTTSVAMLKVVHEIVCRMLKEDVMRNPVIDSGDRVIDYCRASMGYLGREQNRILFLNNKNYLIYDELHYEGTVDYTHIYPREIITRALELRAKSIIMVHNHPSGDHSPSRQDIEITQHIKDIANKMEINLHDHIIVTKTGYYSMRMEGLI